MSRNADTAVVRRYHDKTSHSHFSVHSSGHFLDFDIQPLPFKIYEDLPGIPLQPHFSPLEAPLFSRGESCPTPTLADLARLLFYAAGITRRHNFPSGDVLHFRAAACTGALYEIDLYVACGDLGGEVRAGLYHFSPHDFSLRRLRDLDVRGNVAEALGERPPAALYVLSGATYWRNAWKYQARTWRHFGWDDGTILANLHATADALGLPSQTLCGFVDDQVNALLGLDPVREVAFAVTEIGSADALPAPAALSALTLRTRPLSEEEVDYPLMREAHTASALDTADEVSRWRTAGIALPTADGPPLPAPAAVTRSLHETVTRRGSSRRFEREPMTPDQLATVLTAVHRSARAETASRLCAVYLIVNAVEGVESGAYLSTAESLQPLKKGNFRAEAEYLDLEQPLAGDAALNIYFMTDLEALLKAYGNRGYRAAQLEAGMAGGAAYLAAYGLGIGATGLTFFDADVTAFFSPHAAALAPVFLVAVGVPAKVRRSAGR